MQLSSALTQLFPFGKQKTKIKVYGKNEPVRISPRTSTITKGTFLGSETNRLWLGLGLATAVIVLSVIHLFSANYNVGMGYKVATAQKKLASLTEDNRRLMLKTSETGSIATIQQSFADDHYVPVTSIEYVNLKPDTAVSMK